METQYPLEQILERARARAYEGWVDAAEFHINRARTYMSEVGVQFSEDEAREVREILDTAYRHGSEVALKSARRWVEYGKTLPRGGLISVVTSIDTALYFARRYASSAGLLQRLKLELRALPLTLLRLQY